MATGDVYEVTHRGTMSNQAVNNVYFYQQRAAFVPSSGTIAQALADAWGEILIPEVLAIASSDYRSDSVDVRNLFDPTDQGQYVDGSLGSGGTTMDSLPVHDAWGLQLKHDYAGMRPGGKRYAGVPESSQVDGIPTSGMITALNSFGEALAAPIQGGLIITDNIMFPVVVKRVRTGSPGAYTYRLPENSGELIVGTIIEVLVRLLVTTQNSRKIGVGI